MRFVQIIFVFIFFAVIFSCKEEKDTTPPLVVINEPAEGSSFDVLDQVFISAQASDNEQITAIRSFLVFEDGRNIALNGPSNGTVAPRVNFSANMALNDSLLPSGNYFIRIEADDGRNVTSAFRSIQITGIPRRKLALMAIGHEYLNANLYEDKNDLSFQLKMSFTREHQQSLFIPNKQQLWSVELGGKQLKVIQLKENKVLLETSFSQNFNLPYEALATNGSSVYYATKEELLAYSTSIVKRFSIFPAPNRQFGNMQVGERYLLIEEADLVNTNRQLRILFNDNGAQFGSVNLSEESEDIFFRNRNNALIFSNSNGKGVIDEIHIEQTQISNLYNLSDSIVEVVPLNSTQYLISTDKGVFEFDYASRSLLTRVNKLNAKLAFDEINQEVFIAENKTIYSYSYPTFQLMNTGSFAEYVSQLIVRYNY